VTDLTPLHPDATGYSAFRGLPDGSGRQYTGVVFDYGRQGAAYWLRRFAKLGMVRDGSTDTTGYAVLDVLNGDGDIIQDYDIPTAQAWRYIKRMLQLRVDTYDRPGVTR